MRKFPPLKIMDELNFLLNCGNVDLDEDGVLKDLETMMNKKILEQHPYKIYYAESEKSWRSYLPDATKTNKRRPIKCKSRANLEKKIINYYVEQSQKENRNAITLEKAYEEWLIFRRDFTATKPKTIYENVMEWNKFFKDTDLAKLPLKEIKPITLIKFFRNITKNRDITYKRISNARSVLNGIMGWAIEEEIITHNPVADVNFKNFVYKPVENPCDNVFSKSDTETLLNYLKDIQEPYALAIQLSFYLFIRIGETKAIQWQDVDFENKKVYLHSQALTERVLNDDLTFSSRTATVVNQMKGNTEKGYRTQFLTDEAVKILKKAKQLNPDGVYVFEPHGKIMTTDRFNRKLKAYCEACGIPYHSSHKIRFYNASTAYDGKNLVTISKLMGHSKVETTLHYLRNVETDDNSLRAFENLGLHEQKK